MTIDTINMTAIGVRGAAWRAAVTPWGDVFVNDEPRLGWYIAADDRWYEPAKETTVRQRQLSGVPVIETRVKVPGGDAVQRVYGVANSGGAVVIEVYNDSSLPFAVAFDRADIATMRPASPTGVQGINLPKGSVVFPVGHQATMRVAIHVGAVQMERAAINVETLPGADQVERGWIAALQSTGRINVPEPSWSTLLAQQRCALLLGQTRTNDVGFADDVEFALDVAERVRMGEPAGPWVDETALATERIMKRCANAGIVEWDEERALLAASMLLARAGERRGREDLERVWARLAPPRVTGEMPKSGVRLVSWIESQLATLRRDGAVDLCRSQARFATSWLGVNFECHRLVATAQHMVSFAVRWHGERPALLWEIDGPPGVRVVASALDGSFSTTDMSGETLLRALAT